MVARDPSNQSFANLGVSIQKAMGLMAHAFDAPEYSSGGPPELCDG